MYFTIWPKKKLIKIKVKKITCGEEIAFMLLLWSSTLLFYLWQSDIGEFYISLVLHFIPVCFRTNILQTRTILGKSRNQLMKLKYIVLSVQYRTLDTPVWKILAFVLKLCDAFQCKKTVCTCIQCQINTQRHDKTMDGFGRWDGGKGTKSPL